MNGEIETVANVILGWLLALLTPGISERIRRPYRRRDLVRAVVDEMLGLQYTMALVAYLMRSHAADVSDAFLDKIIPILNWYRGPDENPDLVAAIIRNRAVSEADRNAVHRAMREPEKAK